MNWGARLKVDSQLKKCWGNILLLRSRGVKHVMIYMHAVVVSTMEYVGSNQERNRLWGNVLIQEILMDWVDVAKSLPLPTWRTAVCSPSVQLYFKRVVSFIGSYIFLGHFPDCRSLILYAAWILSLCLSAVLIQDLQLLPFLLFAEVIVLPCFFATS